MRRVGILGGTFSPPHRGHLHAAETAMRGLPLEELWFLPDAAPPHKVLPPGTPSPEQRVEMTELLAGELPGASVCRLELELPLPSYTARTVTRLTETYPDAEFIFIVGSDMLQTLHRWYRPEVILRHVEIAALSRKGDDTALLEQCAERLRRDYGGRVTLLSAEVLELSSTALRQSLAGRKGDSPCPEGLTEDVYRYILEHRLYGAGGAERG